MLQDQSAKLSHKNMVELYALSKEFKSATGQSAEGMMSLKEDLERQTRMLDIERKKYQEHIAYLESTLSTIKGNMISWMQEAAEARENLKVKIRELDLLKANHQEELERLRQRFKVENASLIEEVHTMSEKLADYQVHVKGELAVNEVL